MDGLSFHPYPPMRLLVRFRGSLRPDAYVYAVRLGAETNPSRTATFVSKAFRVR